MLTVLGAIADPIVNWQRNAEPRDNSTYQEQIAEPQVDRGA